MSRASDLDTIAPDDQVTPVDTATPTTLPKPKVINKTKVTTASVSELPIDQKVYDIAGHTTNSFSSFLVNPKQFSFAEKNDNEKILLALRPHWFTNVGWILITILMLVAPTYLKYVPLLNGFTPNYQIIAVLSWYMVTFAYSFEKFLSWYFNIFLVTTERVVDIDFNNLLDKKFSEADIDNIQDVTSRVSGVSQTIFNYGTVLIQTAAEVNQIIFEKVSNPDKVIKVLQELRQKEDEKHHSNVGGIN
jgi:hypothetical protein